MKRRSAAAGSVLALVILVILTSVTGCGSDVANARRDMEKADGTYRKASQGTLKAVERLEGFIAALATRDLNTIQAAGREFERHRDEIAGYSVALKKAAKEYRALAGMSAVGDYSKYGKMMEEAVRLEYGAMDDTLNILVGLEPLLGDPGSPPPVDVAAMETRLTRAARGALEKIEKSGARVAEAKVFRDEKGLGRAYRPTSKKPQDETIQTDRAPDEPFVREEFKSVRTIHFVSSNPENNSLLTSAPSEVSITFDYNLGSGTFISVTRDGVEVVTGPMRISPDFRTVSARVNANLTGNYRVKYASYFSDGYYEEGSFGFSVDLR